MDYYAIKEGLQGTQTAELLKKYWKAKSVEKMKITLYQQAAGREGFRQLSIFLTEFATNSYVHAANLHKVLWGPYTEMDINLEAILRQEREDSQVSFPEYARIAREEGFEDIALAFEAMACIDADQETKFADILAKIQNDQIFCKAEAHDWYCTRCGHVHHDVNAPETCSLCGATRRYFEIKGANFSTF